MAKENRLERYLKLAVVRKGGMTLKFISPSVRGVPDQLVIMASKIVFVELKAPDGRLHPLQKVMHKKITKHGGRVFIASSRAAIDEILDVII